MQHLSSARCLHAHGQHDHTKQLTPAGGRHRCLPAANRSCSSRPAAPAAAAGARPQPTRPWLQPPHLQQQRRRKPQPARASAAPEPPGPEPPPREATGFLASIYKSLRDFGIGRSSIAEGGVGLFIAAGGALAIALALWAKGTALRKGQPYSATLEFPLACGITVGTPVRIRGVTVGSVLSVKPSLDRVDVLVEVNDAATVIPRNSVIEANQSGLIAEPLVDITPQLPIPEVKAGPLDARCAEEGAIVCDRGRIKGQQGVALDDMVYVMTKMAKEMDQQGMSKFFAAAEAATAALEEAAPLLEESTLLAREVTPLLQELRAGGLMKNLEHLTEAAANAAADLQALQEAVLTDENVKALRAAVLTLCKTLEHVESISADVSVFSRDSGVQQNLKTLITALSRIIEE